MLGVSDVGITPLTVQARVRERMAKGRMEAKDGAKAKEIWAKAAAEEGFWQEWQRLGWQLLRKRRRRQGNKVGKHQRQR